MQENVPLIRFVLIHATGVFLILLSAVNFIEAQIFFRRFSIVQPVSSEGFTEGAFVVTFTVSALEKFLSLTAQVTVEMMGRTWF